MRKDRGRPKKRSKLVPKRVLINPEPVGAKTDQNPSGNEGQAINSAGDENDGHATGQVLKIFSKMKK